MPAATASKRNGLKGGRPKGALGYDARMQLSIKRKLINAVGKNIDELLAATMDSAKGIVVYVPGVNGKKSKVYEESPSVDMLKYLFDQAAGKAQTGFEQEMEKSVQNMQDFIYAAYKKSTSKRSGRP